MAVRKFLLGLAVGATLIGAEVLAADHAATDAATLAAALKAANGGDRVFAAPGEYGALTLVSRQFSPAVTISAADMLSPPMFSSITLHDVSGLNLTNVKVEFGAANAPLTTYAVEINRGADIKISNAEILSAANGVAGDDAYGVFIRNSAGVRIENSVVHDVYRGVAALASDDVTIAGNSITRVGSDGIIAGGVLRMTIASNYFADFDIIDPKLHHPDAIQIWSRNSARANSNVTVRGNLIRRGNGDPSQGIFVNTPETETAGLLIEENVVEQSMGQGIFVLNAVNAIIRKNTVLPVDYRVDAPGLEIRSPSRNITVSGNIASAFRLDAGVNSTGNAIVDYHNP